ncbi:quinolinate synthetase [Halarchaeum acidiphilum MH1-52-1]|uniref:Quinolinate synthase n=1 Tax=Halarchaeum acidiphilum MH1-52-1 TaxID=1261545 RepID=U2YEG7_9EURY|nr:quinolinate synthase NadA [Halarchaeum acidiphilum]GAD52196.1 quinolinate synthetase [Halarchaeum acidiphilum MH1-52-1]
METTEVDSELSLFKYGGLEALPSDYRGLSEEERTQRIAAARETLGDDVLVLGHNYQRREIVEHADHIGDSYQLSEHAAASDAEHVVFCGVTFMAESADLLTDAEQTVYLPSMEASCPMAGMAEALQVDAAWERITDATEGDVIPVTYMNSYADLKAFCAEHGGLVCTSSNADDAFEWALNRGETVVFLPDKHLGRNTANAMGLGGASVEFDPWAEESSGDVGDADVVLWDGYCQVHERFTADHVADARDAHPDATVVVHPECRPEVVAAADETGSTATITETVEDAADDETVVVGTEIHLVEHLDRWHETDVVALCGDACMDCNAMRQVDPNYLTWILEELAAGREHNVVSVDPDVAASAETALDRMLDL